LAQKKLVGSVSTPTSRTGSPAIKGAKKTGSAVSKSGMSTPTPVIDQKDIDIAGLNLETKNGEGSRAVEMPPPKMAFAREKLLVEVRKAMQVHENDKIGVSLVVIGESMKL